jgi:SWI/SNF-related matrix-associated actin-dependent regulator of chromatin subfamily A3
MALSVSLVGDYFELLNEGRTFARLDKSFCGKARRLVDLGVIFKAYLGWEDWEAVSRSWTPCSATAVFFVEVHVYSFRHHAEKVGTILLRSGMFLQYPIHGGGQELVGYYNPQVLEVDGFAERPDEIMSEPDDSPAPVFVSELPAHTVPKPPKSPSDHVESILNSLSHTGILQEIRTDTDLIKSNLMRQVTPNLHNRNLLH